jgi:hypothetical protein
MRSADQLFRSSITLIYSFSAKEKRKVDNAWYNTYRLIPVGEKADAL